MRNCQRWKKEHEHKRTHNEQTDPLFYLNNAFCFHAVAGFGSRPNDGIELLRSLCLNHTMNPAIRDEHKPGVVLQKISRGWIFDPFVYRNRFLVTFADHRSLLWVLLISPAQRQLLGSVVLEWGLNCAAYSLHLSPHWKHLVHYEVRRRQQASDELKPETEGKCLPVFPVRPPILSLSNKS